MASFGSVCSYACTVGLDAVVAADFLSCLLHSAMYMLSLLFLHVLGIVWSSTYVKAASHSWEGIGLLCSSACCAGMATSSQPS